MRVQSFEKRTVKNFLRVTVWVFVTTRLWAGGGSLRVVAENPLPFERDQETISIRVDALLNIAPALHPTQIVVREDSTGKQLPTQLLEGELLFQSSFGPHEKKNFRIEESRDRIPSFVSLVDGRFVLPREDYAWENDRIAFRVYGPALAADVNNGMDVWTKRVRYLIVEKWYKSNEGNTTGKDTYHEDHGEGADFFTVGKTLGAGGSGIWYEGKLYQPGVFKSYNTIANGPLRVVFELTYEWNLQGKKFDEIKRISLDAGQNLNKIEVTFRGFEDSALVACGLAKRNGASMSYNPDGCWLSLWGSTNNDPVNECLGTAVVLQSDPCVKVVEDEWQFMLLGRTDDRKVFRYFAGAGWTRSGDFLRRDDWEAYLDRFIRRLRHPVRVSVRVENK